MLRAVRGLSLPHRPNFNRGLLLKVGSSWNPEAGHTAGLGCFRLAVQDVKDPLV